ncbi:hypothetical protein EDD29_0102 [Actinocorallia herbida]|uniref:Uncharacterized protein n=1 Tax=Actinocorallia herbida TaxID=58109 RepID=A0A3N1CMT0_9ACTN|nr:hypothetical protein [Actinocorallia herbida]ROO82621.1 hypothetical protein EDD29_0102 [Actinocorallia herbida]
MSTPEFIDWRGNRVEVGDTVLYPSSAGRSCQITEGTVLDIWQAYRSEYEWKRYVEGAVLPTESVSEVVVDADGSVLLNERGYAIREEVERSVPLEWRIRIQPTRDSRAFHRKEQGPPSKAVTILICENVTFLHRPEPVAVVLRSPEEQEAYVRQAVAEGRVSASVAELVRAASPAGEPLLDPDCRDGKCSSCVGGPCEHECHREPDTSARFSPQHPTAVHAERHAFDTTSLVILVAALAERRKGRDWSDMALFLAEVDDLYAPATPAEREQLDKSVPVVVPIAYAGGPPPCRKVPTIALDGLAAMADLLTLPDLIRHLGSHAWNVGTSRWERVRPTPQGDA